MRRALARAGRAVYYRPKGRVGVRVQEAMLAATVGRATARAWHSADKVVVVHQMGKVGSTSVASTLDGIDDSRLAVLHTHVVDPQRRHELRNRPGRWAPLRPWTVGGVVERLHREDPDKPLEIITLLRDPLARNISAYFQSLERYIPSAVPPYTVGDVTVDELIDVFRAEFDHLRPLTWFDREIHGVYGIDLLAEPFDPERGWVRVVDGARAATLIRTDRLDDVWPDVSEAILGRRVPLVAANESDDKFYADHYRRFRDEIRFTGDELDAVYDSDLCRHFYTDAERTELRSRWEHPTG